MCSSKAFTDVFHLHGRYPACKTFQNCSSAGSLLSCFLFSYHVKAFALNSLRTACAVPVGAICFSSSLPPHFLELRFLARLAVQKVSRLIFTPRRLVDGLTTLLRVYPFQRHESAPPS